MPSGIIREQESCGIGLKGRCVCIADGGPVALIGMDPIRFFDCRTAVARERKTNSVIMEYRVGIEFFLAQVICKMNVETLFVILQEPVPNFLVKFFLDVVEKEKVECAHSVSV